MSEQHPLLANILALAQAETWQDSANLSDQNIVAWLKKLNRLDFTRIYFVGCGTSVYAGQVGKYVVESLARIPAEASPAFAFATYAEQALLGPKTLVVGISATGSSQATVDALVRAKQAGAATLALTAVAESKVAEVAEATILMSGPVTVSVKTKSYVQTLVALYLLALRLADANPKVMEHWQQQITQAADITRHFLQDQAVQIEEIARQYTTATKVFVLGTGPNIGTAEEASLKVIEMAKIFSESQELENFLHGRLREVDQTTPMFFVAPHGPASARVLDFLTVTDYVGAPSVVITDRVTPEMQRLATHVIHLPGQLDELATPLLYITPLYLFSHYLAEHRGYDSSARRYPNIVPQQVRYGDKLKK